MKKSRQPSTGTENATPRARRTRLETQAELMAALRILKEGGDAISISAVATAVGVTPGLIHNKYPTVAEAIRLAAGRATAVRLTDAQEQLQEALKRNAELRQENLELLTELRELASVNEGLRQQLAISAAVGTGKVVRLSPS
jgi:AcrR family transcriptional regulator